MKEILFPLVDNEVAIQNSKLSRIIELPKSVEVVARRNNFLAWIYEAGIVEASSYSAHCADKLFFAHLLEKYAPESASYHPKTRGLSWFSRDIKTLKEELNKDFPQGFVVKEAGGINSGKNGVYLDEQVFFADFESNSDTFLPNEPQVGQAAGIVTSGEKYIVQEKIRGMRELRLHTMENRAVRGATFTRWNEAWDTDLFLKAEESLDAFMQSLPKVLTKAQAWSVDLLFTGQEFRLIEVNTNRGLKRHWSGDLIIPDTLGAYVRHLEKYYGIQFLGESGRLFRNNEANREKYLGRVGEDEYKLHEALKQKFSSSGPKIK